jgi:hypothetical protein
MPKIVEPEPIETSANLRGWRFFGQKLYIPEKVAALEDWLQENAENTTG